MRLRPSNGMRSPGSATHLRPTSKARAHAPPRAARIGHGCERLRATVTAPTAKDLETTADRGQPAADWSDQRLARPIRYHSEGTGRGRGSLDPRFRQDTDNQP